MGNHVFLGERLVRAEEMTTNMRAHRVESSSARKLHSAWRPCTLQTAASHQLVSETRRTQAQRSGEGTARLRATDTGDAFDHAVRSLSTTAAASFFIVEEQLIVNDVCGESHSVEERLNLSGGKWKELYNAQSFASGPCLDE